ncbi:MAG: phage portal protein [Aestuariivirga sp.]
MANALVTFLSKVLPARKAKSTEGEFRPGPYNFEFGSHEGWLSASSGKFLNWWQNGHLPRSYGSSNAMVEACISAYSQTVAMCPGAHKRMLPKGGSEVVINSDLARVLKKPNDYQSMSDLLLNLTRTLYTKGEAFGLLVRNGRNEGDELHLMRHGYPYIGVDGSIFYELSGNEIAAQRFDLSIPFPARDVLHVKLHTPRHPLKGESPILSAQLDLAVSGAALNQQVAFYLNEAKPSFMLTTDQQLTDQQTKDLRKRWDDHTKGENAGGTPILTWGLKAQAVGISAKDSVIADILKLTDQNIALAFRVPLQILGIGSGQMATTEVLMSSWKATGLGFVLNHIEEAFGMLFALKGFPDEYLEFDTDALLRSSFKELIDALTEGTKGVMTSNEARKRIGLQNIDGGDQLFVQMQDIPIAQAGKTAPPPATPPTNVPVDDNLSGTELGDAAKAFLFAEFIETRPPSLGKTAA